MTEPATPLLRRGQVLDWLEELGIARAQTRMLMEEGVIVGAPLPRATNGKAKGQKKAWCYYSVSQIKEKLKL